MPHTPEHPEAVAIDADPMVPRAWRVCDVREETGDTFTMRLEPCRQAEGIRFAPGQFNMVYAFGVGEVPLSISSDPRSPRLLQHTTREVGTVTRAIRRLKKGDTLGIRGPFGTHWPINSCEGRDVVIVAGGLGLAPLRPVLYHLLAGPRQFQRIVLLYGTRTPEDILFRRELKAWTGHTGVEVHVTVDRAAGDWRGNVGVVTTLLRLASFDSQRAIAMVCGPEVMMRYTVMELQRRGLSAEQIHLSMERNMKCAVGFCGHCQYGPTFVCKDGPVYRFDAIEWLFSKAEV
jgi:NAD(P)H-flavin reductase